MITILLAIAAVSMVPTASGAIGMCTGDICDPDRYGELTQSLCGYNVMIGEPYSVIDREAIDPGIRDQIFAPAKQLGDGTGRMGLHGLTIYDVKSCKSTLNSEVITTMKQFHETTAESSSLGTGIGFENDYEVQVTDPSGIASMKQDVKMNANVAFGDSKSTLEVKDFLENTRGVISMAYASCTTTKVSLNIYNLPSFTDGFKNALYILAESSTKTKVSQKHQFKRFIGEYGTHFMKSVELGAQVMETKFLTESSRRDFSLDMLKDCSKSGFSLNIFGKKLSHDNSKCSEQETKDLGGSSSLVSKDIIVTRGSSPPKGSISDWAAQDFVPEPLRMELKPIVNLFSDRILKHEGVNINGAQMRNWFVPMYDKFCETMDMDCKVRRGCGYGDNCTLNEICVVKDAEKGTYSCQLPVIRTYCPREIGFCVLPSGRDQNEGVIKLDNVNGNTKQRQASCLARCRSHTGATGCEEIWNRRNRGCYVHTSVVDRGNGDSTSACWIFSKCKGIPRQGLNNQFAKVVTGIIYAFQSRRYPARMMRHYAFKVRIDEKENDDYLFKKDSSFILVPGLAGKGVSFQALNYPNRYMRQRGGQCYVDVGIDTQSSNDDASFIPHNGLLALKDSSYMSFESVSQPGYYIKADGFKVRVSKYENTNGFREDASWFPVTVSF